MTASREIFTALVAGGMDAADAAALMARAAAEMSAGIKQQTPAAKKQARYRENLKRKDEPEGNKTSQIVTSVTAESKSQTVTNGNDVTLCYDASLSSSKNNSSKERRRGGRLPQDWSLSEADRALAEQRGWSSTEIEDEIANFRDYWLAKPGSAALKLDWSRTWQKWIRSANIKPSGERQTNGFVTRLLPKMSMDEAVEHFVRFGRWSRHSPVNDISQVPADVLAKFKILPDGRKQESIQ